MNENIIKHGKLKGRITARFFLSLLVFCAVFFWPARTINYWQAWVYMGIVFFVALFVMLYLMKKDPELLERRMRTNEKIKDQKLIIKLGWLLFIPIFLIPGFDKYHGWSQVPLSLVILSDVFVLIGYLIVFKVFQQNTYTSRIVEVETDQKVIDTGLYAKVRHPMYSGMLLMYGFTPLALGSYWALIGSFFLVLILVVRIYSEEKYLEQNLKGYKDYLQKVKFRLIPSVW